MRRVVGRGSTRVALVSKGRLFLPSVRTARPSWRPAGSPTPKSSNRGATPPSAGDVLHRSVEHLVSGVEKTPTSTLTLKDQSPSSWAVPPTLRAAARTPSSMHAVGTRREGSFG
jgi:hypothetical protein